MLKDAFVRPFNQLTDVVSERLLISPRIRSKQRTSSQEITAPPHVEQFINDHGFIGPRELLTTGYQGGKGAIVIGKDVVKYSTLQPENAQREGEGYKWAIRNDIPVPELTAVDAINGIIAVKKLPRVIDIREGVKKKLVRKRRARWSQRETFYRNVHAWEKPDPSLEFYSMQRREQADTEAKLFGTKEKPSMLSTLEQELHLPEGSLSRSEIEYYARNGARRAPTLRCIRSVQENWDIVSQLYAKGVDDLPRGEVATGNVDLNPKNGHFQRRKIIPHLLKKAITYLDMEMFGRFHIPEAIAALFKLISLDNVKIKSPITASYREENGKEIVRITNLDANIPSVITDYLDYGWQMLPEYQAAISARGFHVRHLGEQVAKYLGGKFYYEAANTKKRSKEPGAGIIPLIWAGEEMARAEYFASQRMYRGDTIGLVTA